VPENLWRNEVFHDRGDYQGQARADHHHAPGDHSPLEAGYIFADCSRPTQFFLPSGGGPYMLRQQSQEQRVYYGALFKAKMKILA
jgi:hypothetical protein